MSAVDRVYEWCNQEDLTIRFDIAMDHAKELDACRDEIERLRYIILGGNCIRGSDGKSECERLRLQLENAALASVQHEQEWRKAVRERDALRSYWFNDANPRETEFAKEFEAAFDAAKENK